MGNYIVCVDGYPRTPWRVWYVEQHPALELPLCNRYASAEQAQAVADRLNHPAVHTCHVCNAVATVSTWHAGQEYHWCEDCYCRTHHTTHEALELWYQADSEAAEDYRQEAAAQAEDRATWARDQRVRGGRG